MLDGKQGDEVKGNEHASVDEEERQAESEEAPLKDGVADAPLGGGLCLAALGVVAGGVGALRDEEAGD